MLQILSIIIPIVSGLGMLFINFKSKKTQEIYALVATITTTILVLLINFYQITTKVVLAKFPFGIEIALKSDDLSVLFSTLFALVWVMVLIYSFEYLSHSEKPKMFLAFFVASLGGLLGVAYASNLVTMYMFFEIMSIFCLVLVVNERTHKSMVAGRKFIYYSLFGAGLGLISIFYFYYTLSSPVFIAGGVSSLVATNETLFFVVIAVIGFGCKAGLFPLHGWLSTAHPIAPAPASSILSGLVTKAGIIAIIRVVFYTVGTQNIVNTWAQYLVLALALITIFMGSMLAFKEKNLKKRLAYSTVSQVSYVILGLFLFNRIAITGAILQIVYHVLAKNLLFLLAGIIIYKTNETQVANLRGFGGKLKSTFMLFALAGLSLVGVPFTGGFVSKWYLALGALENGTLGLLGVCVVMISAVLTAGYLFSIVTNALFCSKDEMCKDELKVSPKMLVPVMILGVLIVVLGVYPKPIIEFATKIANILV